MSEKLQKVLARYGVGSRRDMEEYIKSGRVSVNGKLASLGDRVEEDAVIRVDGQIVKTAQAERPVCRVLIYNKPEGQMCTSSDPQGRPTVFDRLPKVHNGRWLYIGRLDINTSGLLLFTTDGELANGLMHPRNAIERVYAVRVFGEVTSENLAKLQTGVELEDGMAHFDKVIFAGGEGINRWYNVVLKEGRKREVRRLWEALGYQVSRLKRISYAGIELGKLPQGGWEELTLKEVNELRVVAGLRPETRSMVNEAQDKARGGDEVRREFLKRRKVSHAVERFETRTGFARGKRKFGEEIRTKSWELENSSLGMFTEEERDFAKVGVETQGKFVRGKKRLGGRFNKDLSLGHGEGMVGRQNIHKEARFGGFTAEENKFTRGARLASKRHSNDEKEFFKASSFEEKRGFGKRNKDFSRKNREAFGDKHLTSHRNEHQVYGKGQSIHGNEYGRKSFDKRSGHSNEFRTQDRTLETRFKKGRHTRTRSGLHNHSNIDD